MNINDCLQSVVELESELDTVENDLVDFTPIPKHGGEEFATRTAVQFPTREIQISSSFILYGDNGYWHFVTARYGYRRYNRQEYYPWRSSFQFRANIYWRFVA